MPVTIGGHTGPRPLEAWDLGLTVPPARQAPQPAPPGGLRQRIVNVAKQELVRWGRGTRQETDPAMHDALRAYWQNLGLSRAKADERIQGRKAWSAAFISWVMTQAGAGAAFRKSGGHYVYVAAAKRNRVKGDQSNPFWAFRITEVAPQVGDLVCKARKARGAAACSGVTYDNVDSGTSWPAHCDIVTSVRPNEITVIGGNVSQSVKEKTIAADARGFLPERARDGCRFIAVVKVGDAGSSSLQAQPPRTNGGGAISSLPGRLFDMVRTGALKLKVALAMAAGDRDVKTLTNMLFFARHPERNGARIRPDEKALAREWLDIRDRVIRPALQTLSSGTQATVTVPSSAAPAATVGADLPTGPFGTLTVQLPGRSAFAYPFTPEDLVWAAKFICGEAGDFKDANSSAVMWAMFNKFALLFHKRFRTFADFLRAYSTTLQPHLVNPNAVYRSIEYSRENPGKFKWVQSGTFTYQGKNPKYRGKEIPKGQFQQHLNLQRARWSQLNPKVRALAEGLLKGRVENPIGIASDFANTLAFLRRKVKKKGRDPKSVTVQEWKNYTRDHASRNNRTWIEDRPRLDQMGKNAFFVDRRFAGLPANAVRVIGPSGS